MRWGFTSHNWIESEAEAELPQRLRDGKVKHSLHRWISGQRPLSPVLYTIQKDLRQPAFETLRRSLSKPERDELAQAEKILEEKLRPVVVIEPEEEEAEQVFLPTIEAWTVEQLHSWWTGQGSPQHEYTLEGANWSMLYPKDEDKDLNRRVARIKADLSRPDSDEGRSVYYRLFGLACLMSAGRRTSEIRQFWSQDLEPCGFWAETSKRTFSEEADKLFENLVRQRFNNVSAAGERAYFWRRVFYDVRKIHKMVWENDFPDVMMEVAHRADSGRALIQFLRSGHLPGQEAWVGVFGQSAGAPLFFVVRELRRLGVVENKQLDPFAFFACTPVRRAAARIGWLDEDSARAVDFESLAYVSEQLHKKISGDSRFGPKLLPAFDIPLLHLGINV